jgi:restriction system protein
MPIPDFQTLMRPLLAQLADGKEHGPDKIFESLADLFGLTEDEKRQLQPGGGQRLFRNRIAWARFYLKRAGAISAPRRGTAQITERGLRLLRECPDRVDSETLCKFPEFVEFREGSGDNQGGSTKHESTNSATPPMDSPHAAHETPLTPEEQITKSVSEITSLLSNELLERIKAGSPEFFEQLVVDVLLKLGYGGSRQDAGKVVGGVGDEGIDGVINQDRLGLDTIYVQAKRWSGSVGRPDIQKFAGALQGKRARKGVFITTSTFTRDALDFASSIDSKIVLVSGEQLCQLMIEHGVGVSTVVRYEVKRIDSDYFDSE